MQKSSDKRKKISSKLTDANKSYTSGGYLCFSFYVVINCLSINLFIYLLFADANLFLWSVHVHT